MKIHTSFNNRNYCCIVDIFEDVFFEGFNYTHSQLKYIYKQRKKSLQNLGK